MNIDDREKMLLRLISDASHELVGPANQISSLVALLVNRYEGQLDSDAAGLLAHIESAGARMATTASALRAYLQVIASRFQPVPVSTDAALQEALLLLHREIEECGAEIRAGALPDVHGDPHLICQLFQLLIRNSLKFRRPDASPVLDVSGEKTGNTCHLSVTDNGIGIDPLYQDTIFIPFQKLNGHAYPGAGLGLSVARAIAEMHGGKIRLGEAPQQGARLCFDLPAAADT